jgi:hypothetical protein
VSLRLIWPFTIGPAGLGVADASAPATATTTHTRLISASSKEAAH